MDTNTFKSTRLIANDVAALVSFYENVTGLSAEWASEDFAELPSPHATLAIGSARTVPLFGAGSAEPGSNRTAILEFMVEDVDQEWLRLKSTLTNIVAEPATMPWGNRALIFRDPEGNLVNLFAPVSEEAKRKFGRRAPSSGVDPD